MIWCSNIAKIRWQLDKELQELPVNIWRQIRFAVAIPLTFEKINEEISNIWEMDMWMNWGETMTFVRYDN